MNLVLRAADRCGNLWPFVSRSPTCNTIGYTLAGSIRRSPKNTCDDTFVGRRTRVKREVAAVERAQTRTTTATGSVGILSAELRPSWESSIGTFRKGQHDKRTGFYTCYLRYKCLPKCSYFGNPALQHGVAGFGCVCNIETGKSAQTSGGMLVVDSQLQLRRGALDSVTALQLPFGVDTEHFFSPAFTIQGEGRRVTPLAIFHSEKAHTSPETVSMSANDYMQDTLARSSDSQTQRRCGANPIPALTIAAAAVFAFPIKWGGKGNASHQYGKEDDMDAVQTGDGSTTHCKTIEYGPESTVCTYQRVHPWRPAQHALTLIGRGLQALQQYFIVLTEQLGGGHGGLLGAPMRVKDASRLLWQVFQDPLEIMGSAVNQALGVVILHKDKVCNNTCPEAINKIQPVQGDHSSEKRQVGEKHADANSNTFSGEWALDTSCTRFRPDTWVGDLPEDVECSPGVQHHSAQPKMLDSSAPSSESGSCVGVNHLLSMLMASYRALLLFIRTFGSVLLRLIHVVPLGLTAATAGFWLLGLPYLSVCLRTIGLGSNWVLHWEAIAQRELEEVMFMAVTAAASAAGPTYVKFLQWIATRPDLFHESLCSRCARLQTSVRPFSYPRAALLLREQFGSDVTRHLLLDPTPIGCGCIAQVYRAYLLLSNEASEESKRTFLDHAYVLGGSSSKCAAAEIGGGNKLPPVAVAVKVMRPGVREAMEFDLRVMLLVASVLQLLPAFGFVALKKSVEEFAVSMRRQLDFGLEEKHLKLFRSNFGLSTDPIPSDILPLRNRCRRHSEPEQSDFLTAGPKAERHPTSIFGSLSRKILGMRRQVTFPYPFEALSSSEVIVMTLESGFTLNQLFKTRAELQKQDDSSRIQRSIRRDRGPSMTKLEPGGTSGVLASPAAQKIIERFTSVGMICLHSFLKMVFLDNFFHGDMHSGNLLCRFAHQNKELIFPVLPANVPPRLRTSLSHLDGPLELVVLDCGLAGSLGPADRVNFVTLLEAIAKRRGRDAALAILERAKRSSCQDKEGFCSEVEQLINEHHFEEGNSLQMSRVRLTSLMGHMLSVSKKYRVELDPSFVNIVVAMSVLEGVGAQLCPDADVLRTALPYSLMAARLLNNDSSKEA